MASLKTMSLRAKSLNSLGVWLDSSDYNYWKCSLSRCRKYSVRLLPPKRQNSLVNLGPVSQLGRNLSVNA